GTHSRERVLNPAVRRSKRRGGVWRRGAQSCPEAQAEGRCGRGGNSQAEAGDCSASPPRSRRPAGGSCWGGGGRSRKSASASSGSWPCWGPAFVHYVCTRPVAWERGRSAWQFCWQFVFRASTQKSQRPLARRLSSPVCSLIACSKGAARLGP